MKMRGKFGRRTGLQIDKLLIVIFPLLSILIIAFYLFGVGSETYITSTTTTTTEVTLPEFITPTAEAPETKQSATILVPAVDQEGNGIVTSLKVDVMPGEGRALVNINQLLFWVDTQYSIQSAKIVAQNVTGMDLSGLDIVYTIDTNATVIEGPSAGAALTIATVAALENKTINHSVMITGTISRGGLVGPVGGVVAKATAAKEIGAELFIVPGGQAVETYYEPQRSCQRIGPITYCTTDYVERKFVVSEEAGIDVEEVFTIHEALKYFLV
jgi:uncharacterized protein